MHFLKCLKTEPSSLDSATQSGIENNSLEKERKEGGGEGGECFCSCFVVCLCFYSLLHLQDILPWQIPHSFTIRR